jgi:hypothetical protein
MTGEARLALQPELPTFFGHKPDRMVVDLSGQPYESTLHAFTPGDDDVYLLIRCRVGKTTINPPGSDEGRTMRQALHAIAGYPLDPAFGAERLEQLATAHEHREDQAARDRGKAVAGRVDFAPGDPRLEELGNEPHEFLRGILPGEDADRCQIPGCGRPPADPIHNLEETETDDTPG